MSRRLRPAGQPAIEAGGISALRLFSWYREDLVKTPFFDYDPVSQIVSALGFVALCAYLWWDSTRTGD